MRSDSYCSHVVVLLLLMAPFAEVFRSLFAGARVLISLLFLLP
jgi:hypothetical protein